MTLEHDQVDDVRRWEADEFVLDGRASGQRDRDVALVEAAVRVDVADLDRPRLIGDPGARDRWRSTALPASPGP